MSYRHKDNLQLTWTENVENLTLPARQMLRRVLNEVKREASDEFIKAAAIGQVLTFDCSRHEIAERIHRASCKLLKDSK